MIHLWHTTVNMFSLMLFISCSDWTDERKYVSAITCSSWLYLAPGLNCSRYYPDLVSQSNRCVLRNAAFKCGWVIPSTSQWEVGSPSQTPLNCDRKCNPLWVELWVFGIQRLNFSAGLHRHFWQIIIVSRGKTLNTLVSWLMKKVTSVPPYYPDLPSHAAAAAAVAVTADNSVEFRPPPPFRLQQSNGGFNPFPQVETISSLISLSFCFSLSDGQAAWAVMEGSQTGQRWLSRIIPLWNSSPLLK